MWFNHHSCLCLVETLSFLCESVLLTGLCTKQGHAGGCCSFLSPPLSHKSFFITVLFKVDFFIRLQIFLQPCRPAPLHRLRLLFLTTLLLSLILLYIVMDLSIKVCIVFCCLNVFGLLCHQKSTAELFCCLQGN